MKKNKELQREKQLPRGRYVTQLSSIWEEFIREAKAEAEADAKKEKNKQTITYH